MRISHGMRAFHNINTVDNIAKSRTEMEIFRAQGSE